MMKFILPTCFLLSLPIAAMAEGLPEGQYKGRGDGTNVTMTVEGTRASVALGGGSCVGGMKGTIKEAGASRWRLTDGTCTLEITRSGTTYSFAPTAQTESACFDYGGQGCALFGDVQPVQSSIQPTDYSEPEPKSARCELSVNGKNHGSGNCQFYGDADGSFQIHFPSGIFADVRVTGKGNGDGAWTGPLPAGHAHDSLGTLTRDGACWSNATARVCAW